MPVISGLSADELASMRTAPGPKARAAIGVIRALLRSGSWLTAEISEIDMSRREGPVLYTVDGVVLNDSGYGGLGVFSPIYGSLGTGINLSFIQEVQVKTAAYEPKYGGVNGGVLQIVTKSGGSQMHGAIAAYAAPEATGAGYKYPDNFRQGLPSFQRGRRNSVVSRSSSPPSTRKKRFRR